MNKTAEPTIKGRGILLHTNGKSMERAIPYPPPQYIEVAPRGRAAALPVGGLIDFYRPKPPESPRPRKRFALVAGTFKVKRPQDLAVYVEVEE